jgi:hypothetical protein
MFAGQGSQHPVRAGVGHHPGRMNLALRRSQSSVWIANATANPSVVITPTHFPPCSNASGIIVLASMVRIAPAPASAHRSTDRTVSSAAQRHRLVVGLRAVRRTTDPLTVGSGRAIEVDRVAPALGDGGIETAELFFDRGSVLEPHRLEKVLE